MVTDSFTPTGVVVDEPMARALLYAALTENMLPSDPSLGDGFVRRILSEPPADHLVAHALEQLVLGGRVFLPFWLPREWVDVLSAAGQIVPVEPASARLRADSLSSEILLGMMESRGIRWSADEYNDRVAGFVSALERWDTLAPGFPSGRARMERVLSRAFDRGTAGLSSEQIAALEHLESAETIMRPLLRCVTAYETIVTAAVDHGAMSAVPLSASLRSRSTRMDLDDSVCRVELLRVACRELQRVPIAMSLGQTLKIAASPEARDLRARLSKWTSAVHANDADAAQTALADVADARSHLRTARTVAAAGEYATYIGVPAAIAATMVATPAMAAAGIAISVAGALGAGTERIVVRMNRWAMFARP